MLCIPSGTNIIASSRLITVFPLELCFLCFRLVGLDSDGNNGFLNSCSSFDGVTADGWLLSRAPSTVSVGVSTWRFSAVVSVAEDAFRSSSESSRRMVGSDCFFTFSIFWRPYWNWKAKIYRIRYIRQVTKNKKIARESRRSDFQFFFLHFCFLHHSFNLYWHS